MAKPENVTLVQKGNVIELRESAPASVELKSKDVLDNIKAIQQGIEKANNTLAQYNAAIPEIEKSIEVNTQMLKKFDKFHDWAVEVQNSKVKTLVEEIAPDCKAAIEKEYKHDPTLTEEQNKLQMFRMYLGRMSMHSKVAEAINADIMRDSFYINPKIINPWIAAKDSV
jgi:YesN/AraC family two-component response regulator